MLSRWPFKKAQDLQIRVVYPTGAHELFPLLVPKNDLDEYCPSDDLLNVIHTTVTYYVTDTRPERYLPEPGGSATTKIPLLDASLNLSSKPLLKELAKTIQLNNRPEFLEQLGWYNWVIKSLVEGKEIGQQIGSFVGPQVELLQGYETWSSHVYGKLKPRFVLEIIRHVGLRLGMVFLDLGSGIGNIVIEVALKVACVAVGFEIMYGCAKLANLHRSKLVGRAHSLWGVNLGTPLLFQADFTKDTQIAE
ncbi:uncharacterized protein PGTG_02618 [Puccinia graminis f. sp. tritici CRL 75-36-700-3]|uniref:Histone-lysine N-methyltransferase, H3 lysine-79 specific n=1 Tax=Puccinia graminis f. sp. tritici (strain CRL 75-36-700-3 / race SCCL) TaxID=418459 RepID=E3JVV2_PUCGT|nr:uncharacterized protein PGTG_02618 [Puccinia graminis f. sp. tritici CRL 75-36-700-3]EFP76177.2 hypothetical protein PGTG_02618 [Puccinia graminis f. sp. tritici CRL 75-36-700-3]